MSFRLKNFSPVIFIFFLTLICYFPAFYAPFVFDDISGIANNQSIKNINNLSRIYDSNRNRFLTNFTFSLNYHFGGTNVFGYHLANFIIHLTTSYLIYLIALKISNNKQLSLLAFTIFALHPVQTQAITYTVQRAASLASLFYFSAIYAYLKFKENPIFIFLSLLFTLLALYSKEIAYTLPMALLLTDVFFIKRTGKFKIQSLAPLLIFFLLVISVFYIQSGLINSPKNTANYLATTTGQHGAGISRMDYFISQISIIGMYMKLFILPVNQNFDYDFSSAIPLLQLNSLVSLFFIILLFALAFLGRKKHPLISYGILFFFCALSMESSFFPIEDLAAEQRLYLPMFGYALAAGSFLLMFLKFIKNKISFTYLFLAILIIYSLLTFSRNKIYGNEISLWKDTVSKSPKKARAHMALAESLKNKGLLDEAIKEYEYAGKLKPDQLSLSLNNIGLIYISQKNFDRAKNYLEQAIIANEKDLIARNNLASVIYMQKPDESSQKYYEEIIKIDPQNSEANRSLGYVLVNSGKIEEGLTKFEYVAKLNPLSDVAFTELGDVYRSNNKLSKAIDAYKKAVDINTRNDTAYIGMGKAYLLMEKNKESLFAFKKALSANPKNNDAQIGIKLIERNLESNQR